MRHLILGVVAAPALLASGCVIYAEDLDHKDDDCWSCDWDDTDDTDDPSDTGDEPDPEPEFTLYLTPDVGVPGTSNLLSLRADGNYDMMGVENVLFAGPVDVLATIVQADETLLVVEISPDAQPGDEVQVIVESADGSDTLLDTPFLIIDAADAGGC